MLQTIYLILLTTFYLGCTQPDRIIMNNPNTDLKNIDVVDMSKKEDNYKCNDRELKTSDGCIPCRVIVPDDFSTIGEAIKNGITDLCLRHGAYKEDLALKTSLSIYGQGFNTVLQGAISIFSEASSIKLKNLKLDGVVGSNGVLDLNGKAQQLVLNKILFTKDNICVLHSSEYGVFNLIYEDNKCNKKTTGISIQRKTYSNSDTTITIAGSDFDNNKNLVLGLMSDVVNSGRVYINIYNNVFIYDYASIEQSSSLKSSSLYTKTYIMNNIFIPQNPKYIVAIRNMGNLEGFIKTFIGYNLYEGILEASFPPSIQFNNILADDTFFVDPVKNDYHPTKNSPAIDVYGGYPLDYETIKKDKDGTNRPLNNSGSVVPLYDVGAYEYNPEIKN